MFKQGTVLQVIKNIIFKLQALHRAGKAQPNLKPACVLVTDKGQISLQGMNVLKPYFNCQEQPMKFTPTTLMTLLAVATPTCLDVLLRRYCSMPAAWVLNFDVVLHTLLGKQDMYVS